MQNKEIKLQRLSFSNLEKISKKLSNKIKSFLQYLSKTNVDFRYSLKTDKIKIKTNFKKILNGVLDIIRNLPIIKNTELFININSSKEFISCENNFKLASLNLIKNSKDLDKYKKIYENRCCKVPKSYFKEREQNVK